MKILNIQYIINRTAGHTRFKKVIMEKGQVQMKTQSNILMKNQKIFKNIKENISING